MENSIEEDIKIIENILHKGYTMSILHPSTNIKESEIKAIEHILSDYKRVLKENELAKQTLIKNCNIADERNQLLKENEQLRTEVNSLKEDMSNMYDEEVVISIISDNFNVSRNEVLELLGGVE